MNTGQTMLTILALALLSVITMRYYSTVGMTGRNLSSTNAAFTATTIATSVLEQVQNLAFDSFTDTTTLGYDSTRFSKPDKMTIETGETKGNWKTYDDIDDCNGDTVEFRPEYMNEIYKAYVNVYYINPYGDIRAKITGSANKPTYVKRIDVKVWRSFPQTDTLEAVFDTVRVSDLHGYYFYNPI
jgi:hypothetical protein